MKSFAVLILCILVFPYNTGFSKKVKEEFCVSDQGSTTTCNNYLKAKKALNLSSEFFGVETDRSCRLRAKCGHRSLRMDPNAKCLCDTLCEHFKDCCADYRLWCRQKQPEQRKNNTEDCRSVHGQKKGGYIMVSSCPVTWTDDHIKQKCEDEASLDTMLTMLPVTDGIDFRIYKNIFCALCNKARKMAYWNITVQGNQGINRSLPFHENFPKINDWNATEPDSLQDKVRFCIPKFSGCRKDNSLAGLLRMNKEELERVCNSYAFPLCVKVPPNSLPSKVFKLRNLHCLLCALDDHSVRDQLRSTDSICNGYGISTTLPSQTVVFNFKSSFSSCKQDKIFDPFTGKCSDVRANHNEQTEKNKTQKSNETLTSNCIPTNFSLILGSRMIIVNGSVRPDMHIAVINNSSYVCWNETDKLRCIPEKYPYVKEDKQTLIVHTLTASQILIKVIDNTSYICRNKTAATVGRTVYGNGTERSDQFWVQVVTTIGFAASAFCIIFLLLTYSLFSELRTTPGKSVMSLTCALLVYMACYIPMTSTSYPILCIANAIVLHFSLLSMFFWFNVLAYDMTKRFGNGSKVILNSNNGLANNSLFIKYSAYSWGMPLTMVSVCVALDFTSTFKFGYGKGQFCYISTKFGVVGAVVAPITIMICINFVALIRTIIGIQALTKDSSRLQESQPKKRQMKEALLYLKLANLFGVTWILMIVYAFTSNVIVEYVAVILNSSQGTFLFLGFCFNRRTLSLYKNKFKSTEMDNTSTTLSRFSQTGRKPHESNEQTCSNPGEEYHRVTNDNNGYQGD